MIFGEMRILPVLKDLHIRVTSKCNLNCPHCYAADWFKDESQLDFDCISNVVSQAVELGCKKVTFTGGEPLVAESIAESIDFCLENNLRVEVETNGILIDALVNKLKSNITKVEFGISYDGENMRGQKVSEIVRKNIEQLAKLGCDIKIQTVITTINAHEIDHIFNFSQKLNIRNRVFLAHSPNGNGKDLPLRKINEWLKTVNDIKTKYPHAIIELPDLFSGGSQKKCGWGVHRCEIMSNGDVTSCAPITFNHRSFVAGNINESSLKEIWTSEHFEEIRNLSQKDFKGLCAKCIFWNTCLGACRSISYSTGGDLLSPHPFCSALLAGVKGGAINASLIEHIKDQIENWIKHLDDSNFIYDNTKYEDIVKSQHKIL
jgi:radical SAM protein with 4Fe4S-binding SPASM domain